MTCDKCPTIPCSCNQFEKKKENYKLDCSKKRQPPVPPRQCYYPKDLNCFPINVPAECVSVCTLNTKHIDIIQPKCGGDACGCGAC